MLMVYQLFLSLVLLLILTNLKWKLVYLKMLLINTQFIVETKNEMSKNISLFANSDYGVGITGKLNMVDKNNP